ncbi:hypothetical protein DFH28DRAFT_1130231 [Melampsora americana]|nr:hypothetical protein DFH28DRAFT_1130231 [Melampsora americana]
MSAQSTPSNRLESEVTWLGTAFRTGMLPLQYICLRRTHYDPRILNNNNNNRDRLQNTELSPRGERAQRRDHNRITPVAQVQRRATHHLSPNVLRQMERLDEYIRLRESRESIRRIIKVIQDKRQEEFLILRTALCEVYHYEGPYLQRPGEKEAAAELLRDGNLGAEFVNKFDSDAKWQWLQIRVDAL